MILTHTPAEMHAACRSLRNTGHTLGLVPTMGALHLGHLSLVSAALQQNDAVAVSIFVNPTQFGPNEDFADYPRTFDDDCRKLESAGVHLLFAPSAAAMYPPGNTTFVDPGPIATRLDGASRPGHFRGVATIVTRLFSIIAPDRAYFGQKDAAQVAVLRHIVRDLNLPVSLVVCPIVREPDGLALSSRNRYLSPAERTRALILSRALRAAESLARAGETSAETLRAAMLCVFATADPDPTLNAVPIRLDYAAVVNPDTLQPLADTRNGALLAIAAHIGSTRLIDNLLL
ncbi:MAG: pantoate--beta-alanine ligase [Acidobacteriaceae bacterium]|jgi:pantoate--beta-alanine ligase